MSVDIDPNKPNFRESQWITLEDVNAEHLLDVFTTIDRNSDGVWAARANFMMHLSWHKKRLTIMKPKIEGLLDDHRSKPKCLFVFSQLSGSVGNQVEHKCLLSQAQCLAANGFGLPAGCGPPIRERGSILRRYIPDGWIVFSIHGTVGSEEYIIPLVEVISRVGRGMGAS